jgi:NADP-dependent 3-hydroxy acid dehydrogenase YdfG
VKAKTWFITGSSRGFGRELANQLLDRGDNVALTARSAQSVADLMAAHPTNALTLELDVTDNAQISDAVTKAEQHFGGIDVLVNNAGWGYRAAIEEGEDAVVRAMYDTNVFGLFNVTKAVLPGMRARRSGAIINISSIGGRSGVAGSGYYASTKFAVEGFSDALRKEVGPLGIQILVVEPSQFRTDFGGSSIRQSRTEIEDYAATAGARRKSSAYAAAEPGDPVKAAAAMIAALEAPNPPFHLLLGKEAVRRGRLVIQEQLEDLEAWEQVAIEADYPA